MIDLLAITDDDSAPPPPVSLVRSAGLGALCAPAATDPADAEALWRREAVVEELMRERALLPVRFGTRLAGETEAAAVLAERRDEFAAALDHVRGAVELSLRAQPTGRIDDVRRAELADAVHEPLRALARASVRRPGGDLLRAAYLVEQPLVGAAGAVVRRLQERHPELGLLLTGPWPPYSFATGPQA